MSRLVVRCFGVSLDGYGAGPNQSVDHPLGVRGQDVMEWFFPTRVFQRMYGDGEGETGVDNGMAEEGFEGIGAWILGRNMFGPVRGPWPDESWKGWWGDEPPYHVPVFVLTHHARTPLPMKGGTEFRFVTDGIHAALEQAVAAADGRDVRLGGGVATVREYLSAGLVDELHVAVRPVLLGTGEHLWKDLDLNALGYECHKTVPGERATHVFEEGLVTVPLTPRIALIGDFDESVKAHQGISRALALAAEHVGPCGWEWVHTSGLDADVPRRLSEFQGVWCVPGSPYANTRGAIEAIRFARQSPRPFLGTCGGFQHAMLEYAEAVWGVERAAHAELDPEAADPVVAPLSCGLVEVKGDVVFTPASRLAGIYGAVEASEGYHCNYGLSPSYTARLASGPLSVAARDRAGEVRAVELAGHPFFIATLFQPERSGLEGRRHPLIEAFVAAVRFVGRKR